MRNFFKRLIEHLYYLPLLLLLPATATATTKAVMEGVAASHNTILVDTVNARIDIGTTTYPGSVPNVGLYITSNVVISNNGSPNCVIYATGTVSCIAGSSVKASSCTDINSDFSTSATNFGVGYATVTMTTHGSPVTILFVGSGSQSGVGQRIQTSFLLDGGFANPLWTATNRRLSQIRVDSANFLQTIPIEYTVPALSAGQHSFSVTISADAGTTSYSCTSGNYCQLCAVEQ